MDEYGSVWLRDAGGNLKNLLDSSHLKLPFFGDSPMRWFTNLARLPVRYRILLALVDGWALTLILVFGCMIASAFIAGVYLAYGSIAMNFAFFIVLFGGCSGLYPTVHSVDRHAGA